SETASAETASCSRKSYAACLSAGWQNTSVTRPAGDRAARRAIPTSRRVRLSSPNSACPNDSIAHARSLFMHAKPSTLDRNCRGRIDWRAIGQQAGGGGGGRRIAGLGPRLPPRRDDARERAHLQLG